ESRMELLLTSKVVILTTAARPGSLPRIGCQVTLEAVPPRFRICAPMGAGNESWKIPSSPSTTPSGPGGFGYCARSTYRSEPNAPMRYVAVRGGDAGAACGTEAVTMYSAGAGPGMYRIATEPEVDVVCASVTVCDTFDGSRTGEELVASADRSKNRPVPGACVQVTTWLASALPNLSPTLMGK